jgi:hypothetical protein
MKVSELFLARRSMQPAFTRHLGALTGRHDRRPPLQARTVPRRFSTSKPGSTHTTSPCIAAPNAPDGWRLSSLIGAPRDKHSTDTQSKQSVAALRDACPHTEGPTATRPAAQAEQAHSIAHTHHELARFAPAAQQEGLEQP